MEEVKGDECYLTLDKPQYIIFYFTLFTVTFT